MKVRGIEKSSDLPHLGKCGRSEYHTGDKVQAEESEIPEGNFLKSELAYWSKWRKMCDITFEIFVSQFKIN